MCISELNSDYLNQKISHCCLVVSDFKLTITIWFII